MESTIEIRVSGQLESAWAEWFEGLSLIVQSDGTTILRGPVIDQAALQGVLRRIGSLGLTLISVNLVSVPDGPSLSPRK